MSGYYGTPLGTEDRERKIFELKKKIVKMYGSSLINFLSYQKSVPVIYRDDSPEVKKAKQDEIELIIQEREEEYREREDELLDELNKLIGRIRNKNDSLEPNSEFYSLTFTQADEGKRISCPKCGNKDLNNTILDTIRGDITCNGKDNQGCGEVLEENTIYSGAEKRNFEGEDERNHHGPSPNKLMPDVVNLETSIYIGINGKESSEFKRLSYASQRMEMDLSKIDKDEKHTRQGYKTKMKRRAFKLIEEIGDNLNIHKTVLAQAEIEFAKYRDMKEAVHKFEGTVAACIVIAYEDLSKTMQLDEARKSYNIVSDIARFETTYGNLPSYEEVKDDVAISTVPNLNMGKFTIDQAKVWIEAISQHGNQQKISKHKPTIAQIYIDFQFYGNLLYQYIQEEYEHEKEKFNQKNKVASEARSRASSVMSNESSSNPSTTTAMDVTASTPTPAAASGALSLLEKRKKEKADTLKTLFGNTTISHRLQQLQKKTTNNNLTNAPSLAVISGAHTATGSNEGNSLSNLEKFPGKLLLKIFPKEIIKQKLLAPRTPTPTTTATYQTLPTSTSTAGVLYDENDVQIVHDYFRQAIQRRSSFDKLVVEKLHEQELEMKRIRVEESLAITHRKRIIEEYKQEHGNSNEVKMEVDGEGNQKKKRKLNENEGKISENDEVKIEFVDDIDLEELIGAPVMKVQTTVSKPLSSSSSSGPKGILKKVATASSTSSTNTQIPHVKAEPSTTISVKEEKLHTSPVKVKAEPISSSPASISSSVPSSQPAPMKAPATSTVPAPKKVGMKPRPKIVIS